MLDLSWVNGGLPAETVLKVDVAGQLILCYNIHFITLVFWIIYFDITVLLKTLAASIFQTENETESSESLSRFGELKFFRNNDCRAELKLPDCGRNCTKIKKEVTPISGNKVSKTHRRYEEHEEHIQVAKLL